MKENKRAHAALKTNKGAEKIMQNERIIDDALITGANAYYVAIENDTNHDKALSAGLNLIRITLEASGLKWSPEIEESLKLDLEKKVEITDNEKSIILTRKDFKKWYRKSDWKNKLPRWKLYFDLKRKELPSSVVDAIDSKTDEILSMMGNPSPALQDGSKFDIRGLVVGYVQSGKTGNYVGLINKAIDTGYRYVIVLSGMHDNLRSQTQERIDEGVVGVIRREKLQSNIGVGLTKGWTANTHPMTFYDQDFNSSAVNFQLLNKDVRIWVVKKNKSILDNILTFLQNLIDSNRNGEYINMDENGVERLSKVPLLVIDDEADQASVNTSLIPTDEDGNPEPEYDPTTINKLIRAILNKFDSKTYVGYTATPFANIFIKYNADEKRIGPDLFPKDFIVMMTQPSNYVGPLQAFGGIDPNDNGLPITRDIFHFPDKKLQIYHTLSPKDSLIGRNSILKIYRERLNDVIQWNDLMPDSGRFSDIKLTTGKKLLVGEGFMPGKHNKSHNPKTHLKEKNVDLPYSLKHAIGSFIIGCAVRILRGQGNKHMSMLIHITRFNDVQKKLTEVIQEYCEIIFKKINNNDKDILRWLEELWKSDFLSTAKEIQASPENSKYFIGTKIKLKNIDHNWTEVKSMLRNAVEKLTGEDRSRKPNVRLIGGTSKDLLDYYKYKNQGLAVIVIGGDKLSRGLTLEGLMVSYYLRVSCAYDTLMQMGRWFGYRDGYVDICRIYANQELLNNYNHIAIAFEELKGLFEEMAAEDKSPDEFGLKVQDHPSMLITNVMKMRYAKKNYLDFSGKMSETVVFWNKADKIKKNIEAAEKLILSCGPEAKDLMKDRKGNYIWKNVPAKNILDFIKSYSIHPSSTKMRTEAVSEYIEKALNLKPAELTSWTVILNGNMKGNKISLAKKTIVPVNRGMTTCDECISTGVITGNEEQQYDYSKTEIKKIETGKYNDYCKSQEKNNKISLSFNIWLRLKYRSKRNGLIILYPIHFKEKPMEKVNYSRKGNYLVGFAVVIPATESGIKASYVFNEICLKAFEDNND